MLIRIVAASIGHRPPTDGLADQGAMEWRVMVAVSLLHYLRGRRLTVASAAFVAVLSLGLALLGYAVFLAFQTSDHTLDLRLVGPFRWYLAESVA